MVNAVLVTMSMADIWCQGLIVVRLCYLLVRLIVFLFGYGQSCDAHGATSCLLMNDEDTVIGEGLFVWAEWWNPCLTMMISGD